jgi:hypothetical protein
MHLLILFAHRYHSESISQSESTAILALIISIVAILVPVVYHWWNKIQEKRAIKAALLQEMLINIDSLFNGGIERPFLYKTFEVFLEKLSSQIKNPSRFQELISLYMDLKDYRAVTNRFWPPKDVDDITAHLESTQKQVQTINKFLRYFGEKSVKVEYDMKLLVGSREQAQKIRNKQQEGWHEALQENIRSIV